MDSPSSVSRRTFLWQTGSAAIALSAARLLAEEAPAGAALANPSADEALAELLAGNERFVNGKAVGPRRTPADFAALATGQTPFAAILGCADSRVAPEILFDVGKGDIFVVRVAGNVVSGSGSVVKGSIEYAVAELNVPLILVLGHSNCGAVKAAIQHIDAHDSLPGEINSLVNLIKPAVEQSKSDAGDPLSNAIRKNVKLSMERLAALDPIIGPRVKDRKLKVVGGVYDLKTGKVGMIG